jgi:hypothetical protein
LLALDMMEDTGGRLQPVALPLTPYDGPWKLDQKIR